jgi:dTDP-4-amino-4,6-dideoxygalactose transaminase
MEDYFQILHEIWDSAILTNNGPYHQKLEGKLADYLEVPYLSLVSNATLGLLLALKVLDLHGEVITTPYSFVATAHSILWNNLTPRFVDIDACTLNITPGSVKRAITDKTAAIMPVHVYGTPCDVNGFEALEKETGLPLVYDAAHAFAVKAAGRSIVQYGDLSVLSFHATKMYTTIEGGAVICKTPELKREIDLLKNFGIVDEVTVCRVGINAKMNELQAAAGLASLPYVEEARHKRAVADALYRRHLGDIPGLSPLQIFDDVNANYSYFPVFISSEAPVARDRLYTVLQSEGIFSRRYFYPLISQFPMYANAPGASPENLPVAAKVSGEILCLPLYHSLCHQEVIRICGIIRNTLS